MFLEGIKLCFTEVIVENLSQFHIPKDKQFISVWTAQYLRNSWT